MLGISIGSLNSSVTIGHKEESSLLFKTELLLSETSSRVCPSLLSFGETHRMIGDQAALVLRKNLKSSFQYINRFICFDPNSAFSSTELKNYYYVGDKYYADENLFSYTINGQTQKISPDEIVVSYLHLLYNSYIRQRNIKPECSVFCVPDYFTCSQKKKYFQLIKSSGVSQEDGHLINESSAITLYFGYKKYKEYFIKKGQGNSASIDPTITKYILFVDAGHSKTSFVLSRLSYNLFTVLDTSTIPFLGGRDFDERIYQFCCSKFYQDHKIDISKNNKIKIRLLSAITKARKTLTVNKDAQISVDSLSDDIDFSVIITREEFEKLIQDKVQLFKDELINFVNRNKVNYPNIFMTNVEMAGELMRTPILEKTIKEITKIEMSKTILTDECLSVGCSLYGALLTGRFPIQNFKGIYHLNHYTINFETNGKIQEFISNHHSIPDFRSFSINRQEFNHTATLTFYHNKNEIIQYNYTNEPSNNVLLIGYEINLDNVLKYAPNINQLKVTFLLDNLGEVHINGLESITSENNSAKIELNKELVRVCKRGLYLSVSQINKIIGDLTSREQIRFQQDQNFINFSAKKNTLEGNLYKVKEVIQNNNLTGVQIKGQNVMNILQSIENCLSDSYNQIINLTPLENDLNLIINSITPNDVNAEKQNFLNEINGKKNYIYQNQSQYMPKDYSDAMNMLNNFENKLKYMINLNAIRELYRDFSTEARKYFSY